jgi:hypothetical protein
MSGQFHFPSVLFALKEHFVHILSGYQKRCDRGDGENIPDSTENRTPAIQPVASHLAVNAKVGGHFGDTPAADLH